MALIKCPECGHDVSSNATACPNCGNPVPKKQVPVTFERRKQFNTSQFHASIIVDGNVVGSADNGKSFQMGFPVGLHTVCVRNEWNGPIGGNATETKQFTITESTKSVRVCLAFKNTWTVGKIYIEDIIVT